MRGRLAEGARTHAGPATKRPGEVGWVAIPEPARHLLDRQIHLPKAPRAVITGAGSGLGRAMALRLAQREARLLIADVDDARAEDTARSIRDAGGHAYAVHCDVAKLEDVEGLAREAEQRWRGADLLINNAGVAAAGRVGEMPIDDWRWIVGIDLWGVIHGCHAFLPRMKAGGGGFILNVASCAGIVSLPEMAAYNTTKRR